jgi:branched-chain amino acid transport system substrate-binding protein
MKKQNKIYLGIGIVAVVLIAAIAMFSIPKGEETIKIGWIGPLTGQSATMGEHSLNAVKVAVDEINEAGRINGKQIQLIIEDDQYDTSKSLSAYEKLVNINNVKIILVQTYAGIFSLAEKAKNDGVILIDSIDCNDLITNLGENIFCLGIESESISRPLALYSEEQEYTKIGIVHFNSDTFFPYVKDVFVQEFEGETFTEGYLAGTSDFRTIMAKMKNRNVDAIVLLSYDEGGIAIKQARDLGFTGQFLMPGTVTSPTLQDLAEGNDEGIIFTFWSAPRDQEVIQNFNSKFKDIAGHKPFLDFATYPSYDLMHSLALAIDNANSFDNERINEELLNLQNLNGLTGNINFEQDGGARVPYSLYILVDGVPVKIE